MLPVDLCSYVPLTGKYEHMNFTMKHQLILMLLRDTIFLCIIYDAIWDLYVVVCGTFKLFTVKCFRIRMVDKKHLGGISDTKSLLMFRTRVIFFA